VYAQLAWVSLFGPKQKICGFKWGKSMVREMIYGLTGKLLQRGLGKICIIEFMLKYDLIKKTIFGSTLNWDFMKTQKRILSK